jgi:hypothetical protein
MSYAAEPHLARMFHLVAWERNKFTVFNGYFWNISKVQNATDPR